MAWDAVLLCFDIQNKRGMYKVLHWVCFFIIGLTLLILVVAGSYGEWFL